MYYDKVDLENLIFWIASVQAREVTAKQGCLTVRNSSALLEQLVKIYNRFFGQENIAFLEEELVTEVLDIYLFEQAYLQEQISYPLKNSFRLGKQ